MIRNPEKARESVRRWYHNHADEYNAARREKYASDPSVRHKATLRAKAYRDKRKDGLAIERTIMREVEGEMVVVFTSGLVADLLECTPQMLRNWEKRGWIPPSVFPDQHRLYMKHQVALIKSLKDLIGSNSVRSIPKEIIKGCVETIYAEW